MEGVDKKKLIALKVSDYETIPYSSSLDCPNGDDGGLLSGNRKTVGWCDTPNGLMVVKECTICHQKYRYHGTFKERWNLDEFLENLLDTLELEDKFSTKIHKHL